MPGTSLESMSLSLGPRIRSAFAGASSSLGADLHMVLVDDQVLPAFALLPNGVELREDVRPAVRRAGAVTVEALVVAIRVRHL
ncbi:MAG: hypothetical protein ACLSVD_02495 [Eggerthellaceae bacterium]